MTKQHVATFDAVTETVTLGEKTVQLSHPVATCLQLLLSRQGEIVNKEEILSACWADRGIIVSDVSVRQVMFQLRKALQEAGLDAGYLTNVQRRGYTLKAGCILPANLPSPDAHVPESVPEILCPGFVEEASAQNQTRPDDRLYVKRGLTGQRLLSRLQLPAIIMGSLLISCWIYHIRTAELVQPVAYEFVTKAGDAEVYFQRDGEINREIVLSTLQTLISKKYISPSLNRYIYVNQTYSNSIVTLFACRAPLSEPDNRCYSLVAEDRK
ncbi:TPA: hypothetical protein JD264_18490 [Serratia fonticola]|nr:hypothetical protein [Serratia fonticola]